MESTIVELAGPRRIALRSATLDLHGLQAGDIAAATICTALSPGTELAAYRGDPPLRPGVGYPRLVGYCNVAEVVARGAAVRDVDVGDRILTFQSHRSAFICPVDAVLARVPTDVDPEHAALAYLFHLGYNALLCGGLRPGHHVGVIGLGTLGLATAAVGVYFGAPVCALSGLEAHLTLAREVGVQAAIRKDDPAALERLRAVTGDAGLDIVVTTSNAWEDWRLALRVARGKGTVAVLGFPGRTAPVPDFNPLDPSLFYDKQLTIVACGMSPDVAAPADELRFTLKRNLRFLLGALAQKRLPAARLISMVADWRSIGEVYEQLLRREPGMLSAILRWK